jgi:hypothetical protein
MAKFTDLPDEIKLQILGHLITPRQPVHLVQWRLWALQPDIKFALEDADVEISFALLLSSAFDDIFFHIPAHDAWRLLVPRVRWLVTSTTMSDYKALLDASNLDVVQYAPLLRKMESFSCAKVTHVTIMIDERTYFRDPTSPHLLNRKWAKLMTTQVSSVMDTCSNLKSLHVKLQLNIHPSYILLPASAKFDYFYRTQAFSRTMGGDCSTLHNGSDANLVIRRAARFLGEEV